MQACSPDMVSVIITGVSGGSIGNELIKALRLAEASYHIIGVDMNPASLGLYQADESCIVPLALDPEYVDVLLELCEKKNARVLIPGSEPEMKIISANRQLFTEANILTLINSAYVINLCTDKWKTINFLTENGFNSPKSVLLKNEDDCTKIEKMPVVIKPSTGSGGSNLVFIAQDIEESRFFARYILKAGMLPIAQEYLGAFDEEYTVGVLTTLDGELVSSLAVHRRIMSGLSNRMKINGRVGKYAGKTLAISSGISQGAIEDLPEIRSECERLAAALGSKGPLNIQLRVADGKVYIFEINPRFSGTTAFRALAGCNEPDILIRHHLFDDSFRPVSYEYGEVVRGLVERFIPPEELSNHVYLCKKRSES
ncbi:MAG: ATP-grasp domain-containing protein [Candidatus Aegiribacteria sp.]|nr:ATP-grasp domain-containing protein [Candidatus Aegiribacteria sp.]